MWFESKYGVFICRSFESSLASNRKVNIKTVVALEISQLSHPFTSC